MPGGDYYIQVVYGCKGQEGESGYGHICDRFVNTADLYHMKLFEGEKEKYRLIPLENEDDQFYIGAYCDENGCDRYWTYTINPAGMKVTNVEADRVPIELIPKGQDSYELQVKYKCAEKDKPFPCNWFVSFKTIFGVWIDIKEHSEKVHFKFVKA